MPPTLATLLVPFVSLLAGSLVTAPRAERDTDGDGLPDRLEVHVYGTSPERADSDGDGTPDGDWDERREYTYSVRARMALLPPYSVEEMDDDYQDVRVVSEEDGQLEVEVLLFPLNTLAETIGAEPDWRRAARKDRGLRPYLKAGPTTNFDRGMQRELEAELAEAGILPEDLTDRELAQRVSRWLMERNRPFANFGGFSVGFRRGKPYVYPELREDFERDKPDPEWSDEDVFRHGIYGKGMFESRSRGSCTPSGNLITTVFRALGLPARSIVCVPVVDASDPENRRLAEELTHHRVRSFVLGAARKNGRSFAAHTYNELWIGGRWVRLNYTALGQNILDEHYLGLMVHVHTFADLAEAGLSEGWGRDHPWRKPSETFRHSNPYTCLELEDLFGEHAELENPEVTEDADAALEFVTLERLYWFESDERPAMIGADWHGAQVPGAGNLLAHLRERVGGGSRAYSELYERTSGDFLLVAEGREPVRAELRHAFWADGADVREAYLHVAPEEMQRMERGVPYRLESRREGWRTGSGATVTRP